jgi:hypothetical protein
MIVKKFFEIQNRTETEREAGFKKREFLISSSTSTFLPGTADLSRWHEVDHNAGTPTNIQLEQVWTLEAK